MMKRILLAITLCLLIMACQQNNKATNNKPLVAPKPLIQPKEVEEKVVQPTAIVEVNGITYYDTDFASFYFTTLREIVRSSFDNENLKKELLNNYIDHILLVQEAKRRNINIGKQLDDNLLREILTEDGIQDLKVYTGFADINPRSFSELMKEKILVESLFDQIMSKDIEVNDEKLLELYRKEYVNNRNKNVHKVHLFQIFSTDKQAMETALAELKRGILFIEVVHRYSEGPEKENGGEIGIVGIDDLPESFAPAFQVPVGKYSNIIRTDYGYHIFLVKAVEPNKVPRFADVRNDLLSEYYNIERNKRIKELIDELQKNARINYLNDIDLFKLIPER